MSLLIKVLSNISNKVRNVFLLRKFGKFGKNSLLMKPYMITNPKYIEIGNNVIIRGYSRIEAVVYDGHKYFNPVIKIGEGVQIEQFFHVGACEYVEIGEHVLIAGRVFITDHNHSFEDINKPVSAQGIKSEGRVIIGKNCWLGEGAVILPGVKIGINSIIGANTVVTGNVPDYSIVAGNPGKVIKQFDLVAKTWEKV